MMPPNGELSGSTAGCRARSARLLANALGKAAGECARTICWRRANQRAVGLSGECASTTRRAVARSATAQLIFQLGFFR